MKLRLLAIPMIALLIVAATALSRRSSPVAPRFDVRVVARNLETVWSMAFAPDGRLFITERPGRIRVITRDSLLPEPWAEIPVHESAAANVESGLMGLAVDPQFERNRRVYVCYTVSEGGQPGFNRIAVLTEKNGRSSDLAVLIDRIPAGPYHNGCRLKFGPDGTLYATTGDAVGERGQGQVAQDLASLAGKVLRLNSDGSVPADNPFPGSYVWSYGHRNAQGLAFHPQSGRLFITEHGTGAGGNNELNVIERGKNYGWPIAIGRERDDRFNAPILVSPDAPAGATFVTGDRYPELRGNLLIASIGGQRLLRVAFRANDPQALEPAILIDKTYGRLRDVIQGPDGFLYLSTSNRDGRGKPAVDDDRVLRLVPR
jgi:glucose/arabinose dehydrogenase